jgi:hypothetical protein
MLLARYFFFVGAALLALIFVADAELPKLASSSSPDTSSSSADTSSDLSAIRIKSDRKWPARVVFDTRIPEPAAVQTASNADRATATAKASDISASANVRESFAQLAPSDSKQSDLKQSDLKPREIKRPLKRKIARRRVVQPTVLAARQAPFGFFANNIW